MKKIWYVLIGIIILALIVTLGILIYNNHLEKRDELAKQKVRQATIIINGEEYTYEEILEDYNYDLEYAGCIGYKDLPDELKGNYDVYTIENGEAHKDIYSSPQSINENSRFVGVVSRLEDEANDEITHDIIYFEYDENTDEVNCIGSCRTDFTNPEFENSNLSFLSACILWEKYLK